MTNSISKAKELEEEKKDKLKSWQTWRNLSPFQKERIIHDVLYDSISSGSKTLLTRMTEVNK